MANEVFTAMTEGLVQYLQAPRPVIVTTIDSESKWPTNNLVTWVMAVDPQTVRLVADTGGRIMRNIGADERVLLTLFAEGACLVVEGAGRVITERLEGISLKVACAEMQVKAVRDVTFFGGKITSEPTYDVTYDRGLKEKLDSSVFTAMRGL